MRSIWEELQSRDTTGPGLREILLLKASGYTTKEIGSILGVKETTIWGRYFIMLPKALQKAIEASEQKSASAEGFNL